jgi:hypothetical protein
MQLKELTMITIVAADQKYEAEREASNAQITDLTSRLKISESNCVQMMQKCDLIDNQHTTKYQAVVERLDCAEKAMIEAQKVIVQSMGQVALLESSIEKLEIENVGYILTAEENNEVIESRNNRIVELLDSIRKKDDEFSILKEQSHIDLNKLGQVQEKLNHITIEKECLKSKIAESNVQKQSISKELFEINACNSNLKEELIQHQSDCKKYSVDVQKLVLSQQEDKMIFNTQFATIKAENPNLKKQVYTLKSEKERLIDDIKMLKTAPAIENPNQDFQLGR